MATNAELTSGSASAATEYTEELQLAELVNQEAGLSFQIELKVIRNDFVRYNYTATEHSQTQSDYKLSAVVVEVEPCTFSDIPDDSVDTIHGLFVTVSIQSFTVANQSFTVTVSIQSFILSYAVIACKFPWLCYD